MIFRSVISIFSATVGLGGVIVASVRLRVLGVNCDTITGFIVSSVVVFCEFKACAFACAAMSCL